MRSASLLVGVTATLVLAAPEVGAGKNDPGSVEGTVSKMPLKVKEAIFMWADKADDMTIVLSDRAGVCGRLSAGALSRDATLLFIMLKHNTRENRDAPFAPGDYPLRTSSAKQPQDTKRATFMKLDPSCRNVLEKSASRAVEGMVKLRSISSKPGGKATGSFQFSMGKQGDKLEGRFVAAFCSLPKDATEPSRCE
jgi:hypothetical protein